MTDLPLLGFLILLPLAGAIGCAFCRPETGRRLAVGTALIELALSLLVLAGFEPGAATTFQFVERHAWVPGINLEFLLGIDGLSVLFLPMTALLTLAVLVHAWHAWPGRQGTFAALLLVLQAATIGIFTALDTMLFFLFWELTLPPLFFLISRFGVGPDRRTAAMKYTLYMLFGGVPLLFAFIMLAMNHATVNGSASPEGLSFSLPELSNTAMAPGLQTTVFLLLLAGFGVKAPLFPLHTWLSKAALEGPVQITAWLLGMKLGIYGMLRFMLALTPAAVLEFQRELALAGAVTLIYAGLIALRQSNLRSLLAYAGISHVGLVVMGIASLTTQGIQGAMFQLFNFTLLAFALMLLTGSLHQRLGSSELLHMGGLASVMPRIATLLFLFALASLGAPPGSGFPAELLLLMGNFKAHPGLGVTALFGAVLGAAALLNYLRRALWGPLKEPRNRFHSDLETREYWLLLAFAAIAVFVGIFPQLILDIIGPAAEALLAGVN